MRRLVAVLVAALFITGFLIMLHQRIVWGSLWSWPQILHHEWFASIAFCLAFGILIGYWMGRRNGSS